MIGTTIEKAFKLLRAPAHGDPHALRNERLQILWVLSVVRDDLKLSYLAAAQIAGILRDVEGILIPRQKIAVILAGEMKAVAYKRLKSALHYKIMRAGVDELHGAHGIPLFIDPTQALTEIRRLEEILSRLGGVLRICDPYIENKTLDFMAEMSAATDLRLLTVNVYGDAKVRRDLAAYRRQHLRPLEIRVAPTGTLHDRYIVHDDGMLLLGTSLNGFSKKQSFVVQLGQDIRTATVRAFDTAWSTAAVFT